MSNSDRIYTTQRFSPSLPLALAPADEFTYELVYDSADTAKNLEPAVALSLVRTSRDKHTGLVMLLFNIIYAPYKTML